jgi:vacuolar-type H+-ATPase subunit I/STV1
MVLRSQYALVFKVHLAITMGLLALSVSFVVDFYTVRSEIL